MENKIRKALEESTNYQTNEVDVEIVVNKLLDLFSVIVCKEIPEDEQLNILKEYKSGGVEDNQRRYDYWCGMLRMQGIIKRRLNL